MASISSPGLGSGLDINSIVSQLVALESRPLLALDSKEAGIQANISSMGLLKGSLSNLRDAISTLSDGSVFDKLSISSSDTDVFTATINDDAQAGSFDVKVNRLAQNHKLGSDQIASTTTFGGGANDSLTLTVDGTPFTINLATAKSLDAIRADIMSSANTTGVTASIITGDNDLQSLVLTAADSGYDNRVQVSFGGNLLPGDFGFDTINTDAEGAVIASDAELDASLTVDGIPVTRSTNAISDVIEGVTLNLRSEGVATGTVAANNTVLAAAIDDFVSNVNQVVRTIQQQSADGANSLLRNIDFKMRQALNGSVSAAGSYSYLATVGITTNEDNTLSLDSSKLATALAGDRAAVVELFANERSGIATVLDSTLENFVKSNGVVDTIVQSLNAQVGSIDIQRDRLNTRLDNTERRLRAQFTSLDTLLSSLNTTSSYLTQQLDSLSNILTRNKN